MVTLTSGRNDFHHDRASLEAGSTWCGPGEVCGEALLLSRGKPKREKVGTGCAAFSNTGSFAFRRLVLGVMLLLEEEEERSKAEREVILEGASVAGIEDVRGAMS